MKFSAPARIDLAGGTLDIPPLCFLIPDSVTANLAIKLRVSVALESSTRALVCQPGEAARPAEELPLFDETFRYFQPDGPWLATVENQIPRASGLGGSSSLLVALVAALKCLDSGLKGKVLKWVTLLEHRLLRKPAGIQDAIAALYGGLSKITFNNGVPERSPLKVPEFLSGPLFLAYSKVAHHSGLNNWTIIRAACEGDRSVLRTLEALAQNAAMLVKSLETDDRDAFIDTLQREAALRGGLAPGLVTEPMQALIDAFDGRLVGKVCGAGGGGCMFLYGDRIDVEELKKVAAEFDLEIIETEPDSAGCIEVGT